MKKVVCFTILAFAILMFPSCDKKQHAIDNLSDLVEKVEKNASDFTEEDWAAIQQEEAMRSLAEDAMNEYYQPEPDESWSFPF